jgi:hypothetical protein
MFENSDLKEHGFFLRKTEDPISTERIPPWLYQDQWLSIVNSFSPLINSIFRGCIILADRDH